jgi:outer membrane protein OmpA-like peptidoglycan-associated protein
MTARSVAFVVCALLAGGSGHAWAQEERPRPAAATFWGDTGLWFVPTADVLSTREFSLSAHRTEQDFRQGNTSVSFWPITGAAGVGRVELFGAFRVVARVDRDSVPLLFAGPGDEAGGLVNEYPRVHGTWTGNRVGDLFVGAKVNLLSQQRRAPVALAVRGTLKVPTGDADAGAGTGEYDGFVDLIASREGGGVDVAAFGGVALRGDPDDISISDGLRWGAGAAFPARGAVRGIAEIHGEWTFDDEVVAPQGLLVGTDGSLSPAASRVQPPVTTTFGLTWQHPSGVLLGAAVNYRFRLQTAEAAGAPPNDGGDALGLEFRVGFHRLKTPVPPPVIAAAPEPPPPAPPAPALPPPAPPNRPPSVRARCEPCTIEERGTIALRAEAEDPDGDPLTIQWSTTGGTIADTRAGTTEWHAESAPGLVTFTVTADDGRGAVARDALTVDVFGEPAFDDILFDFDSASLRPEALPRLEPVIAALGARPIRLIIEGHTCSIGPAAYNKALGERRAMAVRDHLVTHGIAAERLSVVTFGEDRPAQDNASPAGRRLNRRAAVVVRIVETEVRP